jgi:hypothetical protein
MSDLRHVNFQRVRTWGYVTAVFVNVIDDDNFTELFSVAEDFSVTEEADEDSGRPFFEFRLYSPERYDPATIDEANHIFFNGVKYERSTHELKRQEPAHWKIIAVPVGVAP